MPQRSDAEIEAVLTAYHGADAWDHNDRADMRAALAAADAVAPAGVPDGWRPIESAPKDGRQVDLWVQPKGLSTGPGRIPDCHFFNGRWLHWMAGYGDCDGYEDVHNVTHWRPLPAPPEK